MTEPGTAGHPCVRLPRSDNVLGRVRIIPPSGMRCAGERGVLPGQNDAADRWDPRTVSDRGGRWRFDRPTYDCDGGQTLAKVIAGMTMSVDGFVANPNGNVDRLYADLEALQGTA